MPEANLAQRVNRYAGTDLEDCLRNIAKDPADVRLLIKDLVQHRQVLLEACKEFVRKVDNGTASSIRSYKQMKDAVTVAESKP